MTLENIENQRTNELYSEYTKFFLKKYQDKQTLTKSETNDYNKIVRELCLRGLTINK